LRKSGPQRKDKNVPFSTDFHSTWLWRQAFEEPFPGVDSAEQKFFSVHYEGMRKKAGALVGKIAPDMPGLTVHDLTHLDALWETASLVAEGAITVSPAEAFVFGASVLLHDSAMSLAAYAGGLDELKQTNEWKDTVAALLGDGQHDLNAINNPSKDIADRALPTVLRLLHAKQAERLAKQGWKTHNGETDYLIDDPVLRDFYGETIGQIAHSHWWTVSRVEASLSGNLGALRGKTKSRIDKVKLACLLRIADALHLDQRRAPRFLRALTRPQGKSALHWDFQGRFAFPDIEDDAVVFSASAPFEASAADAWWLAYDTICAVDRELRDVDLLLQTRKLPQPTEQHQRFRARRVKGAESSESFAGTIPTQDWRPVDTRLRVSDIPKIVETLGGAKLYGDDPTIALRELIQNSVDAVQARRLIQGRAEDWGNIKISLSEKPDADGHYWLSVEDNGVGMSESVLTGPLIDFGVSFWRSTLATEEFPGLGAKGMNAIGRFGIGFYSVFMLGSVVRVISQRYDYGEDRARILEFRNGLASRPILLQAAKGCTPVDRGTRVEVRLNINPRAEGGLLMRKDSERPISQHFWGSKNALTLHQLVGSLAPSVSVSVEVKENGNFKPTIKSGDWLTIPGDELALRLNPNLEQRLNYRMKISLNGKDLRSWARFTTRPIFSETRQPLGRACIMPGFHDILGYVTIGGLRADSFLGIQGILVGDAVTVTRNSARLLITKKYLAEWATEQARIITAFEISENFKASCTEVVLACGGKLDGLPIAYDASGEWLDTNTFSQKVENSRKFGVPWRSFFDFSEIDQIEPDIIYAPASFYPEIDWIRSITGQPRPEHSYCVEEVQRLMAQIWGTQVEQHVERDRVIGTKKNGEPIKSDVTVFCRAAKRTKR
jgi:hypothetical protein